MSADIVYVHLSLLDHQHMHERMRNASVSANGHLHAVLNELPSIVLAFVAERITAGGSNINPADIFQVAVKWTSKAYGPGGD